jgi:hypothetical protein
MTAQQDEPQRRSPGAVRRFIARLHDWWHGAQRPLPIYEFEEVTALMDGWQTHVVRLEATSVKPARLDELPAAESDLIEELQTTLANIDASAPIPPRRIAERIARMDVEPRSSVFAGRQDQPRRPGYGD